MTIYNAYLIKGYLIDKKAPKRIMEALDTLIGTLHSSEGKPSQVCGTDSPPDLSPRPPDEEEEEPRPPEAPRPEEHTARSNDQPASPINKKREWTPEARAAAAERMKKAREARAAKKAAGQDTEGVTFAPTPSRPEKPATVDTDRLLTVHNDYAGKREDATLTDSDWPYIKARLAKSPDRRAIASDYDVELDDLNFFIASCQRREGKSPGEALASPSSVTSGATQRRT